MTLAADVTISIYARTALNRFSRGFTDCYTFVRFGGRRGGHSRGLECGPRAFFGIKCEKNLNILPGPRVNKTSNRNKCRLLSHTVFIAFYWEKDEQLLPGIYQHLQPLVSERALRD